jgi:hypothetical protein
MVEAKRKEREMNNWQTKELARMAAKQADAHQDANGFWRWNSNDQIPFGDMLEAWGLDAETVRLHEEMRNDENMIAIREWAAARDERTPEQKAEEAFERRAAFGPGVTVVNVLTGERVRT